MLAARALEFERVIVSSELVLMPTGLVPNDLVTVIALPTVSVALAVLPVTLTGPEADGAVVVFELVDVAVTLWVTVQVPPGTIVPALKPTLVPPFKPPVRVAPPNPEQVTLPVALFCSVPV